jgi:uncharacterized HAD superfamily protein
MEKIGIDLDDVIIDFVPNFLKFYNQKYRKNINFEDVKSYNFWEVGIGKNRDEVIKIVGEFFDSEEFNLISLVDGAKKAINKLSLNYQLYTVTSRSTNHKEKTEKYIQKHFSKISIKIIYSGDFYKEQGKTKSGLCDELDLNYIIEDNLKYALECSEKLIGVFLFDKPWNQGNINGNITRVKSWEEILELVK